LTFHWRSISFPFNDFVDQAVMFDSANGWALSSRSQQLYYLQDGGWQIIPIPNRYRYDRLFAVSPQNIWISCFDNISYRHFLRHFNGKNWHNIYTPNADQINDLDYLAKDNIWGVCEWGEIIHFNGKTWELVPSPVFTHLNCIKIMNDSTGWIGGEYRGKGMLLQWNGQKWKVINNKNLYQNFRILKVSPAIGWVFSEGTNYLIRLKKDQCSYFNFASSAQDTIVAVVEYHK